MTQVFFYHGAADKIIAACALLGGAYAKKKPMLVFAPEKEVADSVDRSLWTQSALGFIPHCRADSPLAAETPILIADNLDQLPQDAIISSKASPYGTEALVKKAMLPHGMQTEFTTLENIILFLAKRGERA